MPTTLVETTLTKVASAYINNANAISVDLVNNGLPSGGGEPLDRLEVRMFANKESSGVTWFSTGTEFTDPAIGTLIEGLSQGIDPTTLAVGAATSFRIARTSAHTRIEIWAGVASGSTELSVYIGGGPVIY